MQSISTANQRFAGQISKRNLSISVSMKYCQKVKSTFWEG